MALVSLSEAERVFVIHGIQDNHRNDGRTREQYRPLEVETGVVPLSAGSARLRLASTDVLVSVKAELATPAPGTPHLGRIEFSVDCSANATPEFEGRGGDTLAGGIARCLSRAYAAGECLDLSTLCIVEGQQCWLLYVDVLILESGGNLYDAASCAVLAALYSTQIPTLHVTRTDSGRVELDVDDDPALCFRLDVRQAPCLVTLLLVDSECIVDPSPEEEVCSKATLVTGVTESGKVTTFAKMGRGSMHTSTFLSALKMAVDLGVKMNKSLRKKLAAEEAIVNRQVRGFLG